MVGGGVSGLATALLLSARGHELVLVEQDDTPLPDTADEAFQWERHGAPQVRHSHAFLARLTGLLRTQFPDLYAELLDEGAWEIRFGEDLPPTMQGFVPEPADDELTMLACRRTTFEWLLRRAVEHGRAGTVRVGTPATGLRTTGGTPVVVDGLTLADGSELDADLVVVASGRRSALPAWLESIGATPPAEQVEDTGIVYLTRFYRLHPEAPYPPRSGPIGGDLGYLKYGVFVADNRTFSVTLAVPTDDATLRRLLTDPDTFDACARLLVATAPYLDGRATPLDGAVHVMAGLLNRWRPFVADGRPVAVGVVPVGDAVVCTNPLYGRGCSLAFWAAELLGDALDAHGDDTAAVAVSYSAALERELGPWYRAAVSQDAEARRVSAALLAGDDPDGDVNDPRSFMRSVFRDGLLPAMRTDPVVLRAFVRTFNLLCPPDAMITDTNVSARVFAAWQDRDNRPPEPVLGPRSRADLLAALGVSPA